MKTRRNLLDWPLLHPVLFGLYPALAIWLANIEQLPIYGISRVMVAVPIAILLVILISLLIFRNRVKAGIFASFFLLMALTYGHLFGLIDMKAIGGFIIGRHRYTLPIWLVVLAVGSILIWRKKPSASLVKILNIVGMFLVAFVFIQILLFEVRTGNWKTETGIGVDEKKIVLNSSAASTPGPDVYYIILDAYGREDLLRREYHIDTSAFVKQLTDMGFIVEPCSQSNYVWTPLSIGSSLNMNYLDTLGVPVHPEANQVIVSELGSLLFKSAVRKQFEALGYQTMAFKGVYPWLNMPDTTYYYDVDQHQNVFNKTEAISFEYLFLRTTIYRVIIETEEFSPQLFDKLPPPLLELINPKSGRFSSREYRQYQQNLYALDMLSKAPQLQGKKFVYAHLFLTHQPFTFNPDGSFRWPPLDSDEAYADQVRYADVRMVEVLKDLIRNSKVPPIIVMQGDHSYTHDQGRVDILNAYYLPGNASKKLYPTITPVNTFRIIFNQYFGGSYPLLVDQSYFSLNNSPYQFTEITPSCPAGTVQP